MLYVGDDRVLTSAGTAAGIDLCLHLVREVQGTEVANALARRMVVPPHRDGGQAQYVDLPMPPSPDGSLSDLLAWMSEHLDDELPVDQLAAAGADVAAHLRPAVPRGDRDDPAPMAGRAARPARPGAARVQ